MLFRVFLGALACCVLIGLNTIFYAVVIGKTEISPGVLSGHSNTVISLAVVAADVIAVFAFFVMWFEVAILRCPQERAPAAPLSDNKPMCWIDSDGRVALQQCKSNF